MLILLAELISYWNYPCIHHDETIVVRLPLLKSSIFKQLKKFYFLRLILLSTDLSSLYCNLVRISQLHLTICQKEIDTCCEKLVILLGSSTFKESVTGPSLVSELLFSREIEANIFMWPYGVCSQQEEFIYTRIISAVLRPLRYNNRQQGQKTDQHHAFKLTGTHKNTCQLHYTRRQKCVNYKLYPV